MCVMCICVCLFTHMNQPRDLARPLQVSSYTQLYGTMYSWTVYGYVYIYVYVCCVYMCMSIYAHELTTRPRSTTASELVYMHVPRMCVSVHECMHAYIHTYMIDAIAHT